MIPLPALAADSVWQEGQPFLQSFAPTDYHGATQCWGIVQDSRGIMYIGNDAAVLEYDGATWRKVRTDTAMRVYSLAYEAATDTVFVGGTADLGYLRLVPGGERQYVSLLKELPEPLRAVGEVRSVIATTDGIYFFAQEEILRWRNGHFDNLTIPGAGRLHSGYVNGKILVHNAKVGLLRLENDKFVPVSDDPVLHQASVQAMAADVDGALMLGTRFHGLLTVHGAEIRPWQGEAGEFIKKHGAYHVLRLRDGSLAVATGDAGIVIFDQENRFRNRLDASGGLHEGGMCSLAQDAAGGLWVGEEVGLARAEINSPWSVLRAGPGDPLANCFGIAVSQGTTYLSSLLGLYRIVPADATAATGARVVRLPEAGRKFYSLCPVEGGLLAGVAGGLVYVDAAGVLTDVPFRTTPVTAICRSGLDPGRVFACEETKVHALHCDPTTKRWVDEGVLADAGISDQVYTMAASGADLWLGTKSTGAYRVRFSPDGGAPQITAYAKRPGLLQNEGSTDFLAPTDGKTVLVATGTGLFRFDESVDDFRKAPEYGTQLVDGTFSAIIIIGGGAADLWLTGYPTAQTIESAAAYHATAGRDGKPPVFEKLPAKLGQAIGEVETFLPWREPSGAAVMLISGTAGLVRLDLARWHSALPAASFDVLVRRAVSVDQAVANGTHAPILAAALPYTRNTTRFEFAAPVYAFGTKMQYQTRIVRGGRAGQWSDFSEKTSVDYFDLREGSYDFEVQARDSDGQLSAVAELPFRVLPPWQRTFWAYYYSGTSWQMGRGSGVSASKKVQKAMFSTVFGPESRRFRLKSSLYYCNTTRRTPSYSQAERSFSCSGVDATSSDATSPWKHSSPHARRNCAAARSSWCARATMPTRRTAQKARFSRT